MCLWRSNISAQSLFRSGQDLSVWKVSSLWIKLDSLNHRILDLESIHDYYLSLKMFSFTGRCPEHKKLDALNHKKKSVTYHCVYYFYLIKVKKIQRKPIYHGVSHDALELFCYQENLLCNHLRTAIVQVSIAIHIEFQLWVKAGMLRRME